MTERLSPDPAGLARAAALLRAGRLVAFGTETVYGLGADATNADAVAAVFAAKDRPRFNPLISHYPDAAAAFADGLAGPAAHALAAAFWPGPLTLVLPRRTDCRVTLLAGAGLDTLALRVPAHEGARALLRAVGRPVAAPSANRSGRVSPTTAAHVLDGLDGRIAAVLDSGPSVVGVESTVLDLSGPRPRLLRPGGVTLEALAACLAALGIEVAADAAASESRAADAAAPRAPGQLASHYAPSLPVRLNATSVAADEALLSFGPPLHGAGAAFALSPAGDPAEAAARLFAGLRALDALGQARGLSRIAAMPVPEAGLGRAINDRLRRAAAPR
jgi:L-threonylcarbamoyladenylate synthase